MTNHFLYQVRNLLEIGIGPIRLQHGELGIVPPRNSLVPEIAIEFENFIESAHYQTFQIEFRRDPQIKDQPEWLVMGCKWFSCSRACDLLLHAGLHLHTSVVIKITPILRRT